MKILFSFFSKRHLMVFLLSFLFINLIFTQEPSGSIRIKFKNSMTSNLKSLDNKPIAKTKDGFVKTGIGTFDKLTESHKVVSMKRVFRHAGKFEARHMKYGLHLWYELDVEENNVSDIKKAVEDFKKNEGIEIAEQIFDKELFDEGEPGITPSYVSNDPMLTSQWHYRNTGQTGGTIGSDIKLTDGWNLQQGRNDVIVAVIDGGIDINHIDLNGAMWINQAEKNGLAGIDDDGNGYVDDVHGYGFGDNSGNIGAHNHGTHVGGTIGAISNNGTGVAGIAGGSGSGDGVRLMSCATFGTYSTGGFAEAFVYAADMGAVIAQNSWGYTNPDVYEQTVLDAIDYFIANAGKDPLGNQYGPMDGGIVIFAAGNDNTDDEWYPGYYDHVLSVASINHNSLKAYYSNYGGWVDVSAPGGETIYSTEQGVLSTLPGNNYGYYQGTSMACPHVSGLAALIVSEFGGPGLTPLTVWDKIINKADSIDILNPLYAGKLGTGCINSFKSLTPSDTVPPAAITDLTVEETSQITIVLSWTATGGSGIDGKASKYDVRYATYVINEENFNSATSYMHVGAPKFYGEHEILIVEGLNPATNYYFALKAIDSDGNRSSVSNIVQGETENAPVIKILPASFNYRENPEVSLSDSMLIQNNGTEILNYNISLDTSAAWLNFEPTDGTLDPEDSTYVDFLINTSGIPGGSDHYINFSIISNDPLKQVSEIPIFLHVNGIPIIQATDTITFGKVMSGNTDTLFSSIINMGNDVLVIDSVVTNNMHFGAICAFPSLNPLDSANIIIWYKPNELQVDEGLLFIYSNDYSKSPLIIHMIGESAPAPEITASPDSFRIELFTAQKTTENLTIHNSGGTELKYSLEVQYENQDISTKLEILSENANPANYLNNTSESQQFIKECIGVNSTSSILLLEDVPSHYYYNQALENLGLSRTLVSSWSSFESYFYTGDWDLVIINTYGSPLSNISILDSLNTYVENGGKIIFATWDVEYNSNHPFFTQSLGINYIETIFSPLKINPTANSHPVFNFPNLISEIYPSSNYGNRDGQIAIPQGNALSIACFEGYPTSGSIVLNSSNTSVYNAFQSENYNNDDDFDGKTDIVELLENEVSWLISSAWIKPALTAGQIQPGINQDIELLFDATGLNGGNYFAHLNIKSNDPRNSLLRLPVHMHVQGVPIIEAGSDTLNFGSVFSMQSDSLELTISNKGTDLLYAKLSSDDVHFKVAQDSLTLSAGASTKVKIFYFANEIMQNEDKLTIVSNDPFNPSLSIILLGNSLEAPVISAAPDSFDVFLRTSETTNEVLTINNSGGSDLIYQLEIQYANEDISEITEKAAVSLSNDNQNTNPALPYGQKRSVGLNSSIKVLLYENGIYYNFYNTALQNLGISRTQVTDAYSFLSQFSNGTEWDLIIINSYYNYMPSNILDSLYDYKGKIIYSSWDLENHASHPFITQKLGVNFIQSIYTPINFNATNVGHQIFNYPNKVSHFRRTDDQAGLDGQIAEAAVGFLSIASFDGFPSSGSIILNNSNSTIYNAFQAENFNSEDDGDGRIDIVELIENEISWLISSNWLKPSEYNGIVVSEDSRNVDIEFNANLPGGDYYANINILSNDPDNGLLSVPAHMHIDGVPIIKVNVDTLNFGTLFVSQTDTADLVISNIGSDTLRGSLFTDNASFTLSETNLILQPYESESVMITYTAENAGIDEGILTISSNDSINPTISVILIGESVNPPSMAVIPDSIYAELTSGDMTYQDLTIQNNGGSKLNISIDIIYETNDTLSVLNAGVYQPISTDTKIRTNHAIQPSIEGNDILVIQDKDAWSFYMSTFIQEKFGIVPDVINSSQIPTLALNNYKLIITTGDQYSDYYENISNNVSRFEDFVRQGGILQYQLATQGSSLTLVDNVNLLYGNLEYDNINLNPGHPIFAGLPSILHGSYANHCYFDTLTLPENAVILTKTRESQVPTTVEYSFGTGKVIATGMTWELYHMFDDSVSVEWNACNYSISICDAGWLVPEKNHTEINQGNTEVINLLLNSRVLEPGDYRAHINISSNDPEHSVINVPVHLHINPDTTIFVQQIPFQAGWNIFSLNVIPDHTSMMQILQPLINSGALIKVQNESGGAIEPMPGTGNWIDNIGNWSITEGYKIRLTESSILEIPGTIIYDTVDIPLRTGWNIIGYPFRNSQDAMIALDPLILSGHLMKVQNENGAAIEPLPDGMGWINNIGALLPGEGYKVRVSTNDVISLWQKSDTITGYLKAAQGNLPVQHFVPGWQGNGHDHMNIYVKANSNLMPGDEIGVFDGEICVGSLRIDNNENELLSIAVSADDPETFEPDGFGEGNPICLKSWKNGVEIGDLDVEFLSGYSDKFEALGTTVAEISLVKDNSSIELSTAYPNPFYELTRIPITVIKEANIDLSVYNLMGQKIITLVNERLLPDNYEIIWDGTGSNKEKLKAGIYLIKLSADGAVATQQIGILD